MKNKEEIKIAIFVLSGLFLLIFGWAYLREITLEKQLKLTVVYDDVSGLSRGSFVHVSGLRVGRVDRLTLDTKKHKVYVDLRVQLMDVQIPEDSKFIIRTSGYVGDKYLDVKLGDSSTYLKDGDVIAGEAVFDSFKSLDRLSEVINELDPKELGQSIQEITTGTAMLVKKVDLVADSTNEVIMSLPKGEDLNRLVSEAHETVDKLNSSIEKAESIANKTEHFVNDDVSRKNLNSILSQAKDISIQLNSATKNANSLATNKEAYENVNSLLVRASTLVQQLDEVKSDPLIQNDVRETLTNTNDAAKKVAQISEDLNEALHQRFLLPKLWFGRVLPKKKVKASVQE